MLLVIFKCPQIYQSIKYTYVTLLIHYNFHYIYHMNGTSYIILIDTTTPRTAERGTEANYRPVVCGVTNGFNMSFEAISLRNKCDGGWDNTESGYGSWGLNLDGQAIALRNVEKLIKANYDEVANLAVKKRVFWAKMGDLDNKRVIEGLVRIGSYSETADLEEPYTFTVEFVGLGEPIIEENAFILVLGANEARTEILGDGIGNLIADKYD